MNREIKFRAWHKTYKQILDLQKITPLAVDAELRQPGLFIPFNPSIELMQFTGFKDKYGVEIYEGDILATAYRHDGGRGGRYRLPVVWSEDAEGFRVRLSELVDVRIKPSLHEVIGNIYENPELLEKENDDPPHDGKTSES